jgi:hypothetical protein
MDTQFLPLPRKRDIYPSGISAPVGVCYIRYGEPTTAVYLLCNGFPVNHCSLAQEMTIVSRFVYEVEDVAYLIDTFQAMVL